MAGLGAYQQALGSTDQEFIKQVRSVFKSKLTRELTSLNGALVMKKVGDSSVFDHDEIDKREVENLVGEISNTKKAITELHMRYQLFRKHLEGAAEEALEQADNEYITDIDSKVRERIKQYNRYLSDLEKTENEAKAGQDTLNEYEALLRKFKTLRVDYESCQKVADVIVESEDDSVLRTAANVKTELQKLFENLVPHPEDKRVRVGGGQIALITLG